MDQSSLLQAGYTGTSPSTRWLPLRFSSPPLATIIHTHLEQGKGVVSLEPEGTLKLTSSVGLSFMSQFLSTDSQRKKGAAIPVAPTLGSEWCQAL